MRERLLKSHYFTRFLYIQTVFGLGIVSMNSMSKYVPIFVAQILVDGQGTADTPMSMGGTNAILLYWYVYIHRYIFVRTMHQYNDITKA